jgi:hypothetical protein
MILYFNVSGDTLIARVQKQALLSISTRFVKKCKIFNSDLQACYH